jgi:hypothetical protein
MSGETIGLISLGIMVLINIIVASVAWGRSSEMLRNQKEQFDRHCAENKTDLEKVENRLEYIITREQPTCPYHSQMESDVAVLQSKQEG